MNRLVKTEKKTICMFVFNTFENDSRVLKQASLLVKLGYQVHILARWKEGLARKEHTDNIIIHRLETIPFHIRLLGQKKLERLKKIIFKQQHHTEGMIYSNPGLQAKQRLNSIRFIISIITKSLLYASFYGKIGRYIQDEGIQADVYHAHDLNTLFPGRMLAGKHKARLVYDAHELYVYKNRLFSPPKLFLQIEQLFEKVYVKKADAVITVNNSIADYMEKKYQIAKPCIIMNTPSQNQDVCGRGNTSLKKALGLDDQQKILLHSGGITFNRGLEKVIKSLVHLDNIFFVMMGYGKQAYIKYLKKIASDCKVSNRVRVYGPVPSNMVTSFAATADIGIAPIENVCLNNYYSSPNKVFEYIQGGLPIVASNFPELNNIVEANEIGKTFKASDPEQIAAAVKIVLQNYKKYAINVRSVKDKYCWENESKKLTQLYSGLLKK